MLTSVPLHDARAKRIVDALVDGADIDSIALQERLPPKEVQAILRDELGRRWVPPVADFAKIQIARLESLCQRVMDRVDSGDIAAIDRALRIIDRLDRYHGFQRGSPALQQYGEEERDRLLAKINEAANRLYGDPVPPTPFRR